MIRIFPRKTKWTPTDKLSFIGDPPLFRPPDQPVRISCAFTWDKKEAERLALAWKEYYLDVLLGGPAYDSQGGEFNPGVYIKEGVTITSRGCPRKCPWCFVPIREGGIRELEIKPGWILQDNNILACSKSHILRVFEMLKMQNRGISFNGGLDCQILRWWHVELLQTIKIKEIWFTCDDLVGLSYLINIQPMFTWLPESKRRCYAMIGYRKEMIKEAEYRLINIYRLGFLPFAQLYRDAEGGPEYSKEWKDLARKWSRPAAYRAKRDCAIS